MESLRPQIISRQTAPMPAWHEFVPISLASKQAVYNALTDWRVDVLQADRN
jgi:hypothetical protein